MVASLVAAMVAALCYGVAAVLQAMADRAASLRPAGGGPAGVDPGLGVRLPHQWGFIASLGLDLIGFLSQLVALRQLPLFAVQAMIAANLAVTAVFAAWLMHVLLSWRGGGLRRRHARLLGRVRGRGPGRLGLSDGADRDRGRHRGRRAGRGEAAQPAAHPGPRRDRRARLRGAGRGGQDPARLLAAAADPVP